MKPQSASIKKFLAERWAKAAIIGFAMLIAWDCLWAMETTFRGMSFVGTYANALAFALVLALPSAIASRRWIQLLVWLIAAAWLESNLMYCRTYMSWIPLQSYMLASNLADFTASITDSMRWLDLLTFAIPIAGYFWIAKAKSRLTPYCIALLASAMLSWSISLAYGGASKHINSLIEQCYYATTPPVIYTLPTVLATQGAEQSDTISDEDAAMVAKWLDEHSKRAKADFADESQRRDNLVIIFCESMENWLIDAHDASGQAIMPNLRSLVDDSTTLYLPHVLTQVGTGRSIDAQLLMLAGMYPLRDQVWSMKYPHNKYQALPGLMKQNNPDLTALLLTSDKPITWNQSLVAKSFGIDTLLSRDSWQMTEMVGNPAKLSDGALFTQIVDKMKAEEIWPEGSPAYLQIVTYSGHNPFVLPDNLKAIEITGDYPAKMTDYMTMNNYVDKSLVTLIEYLKQRSDWPRTMVAIVGDHEGLGSYRKEWRKNPEAARILPDNTYVPLIVLNSPFAGMIEQEIGQADVFTTLIDLLDLDTEWTGLGQTALRHQRADSIVGNTDEQHARSISEKIIKHDLLAPKR